MMRLLPIFASTGLALTLSLGAAAASDMTLVTPGQLTVAYRTDDKPVSFIQDGVPSGLYVDFENALGARLHLKVSFISTSFAAMLPAVRNHQYDTAAFGVLVTPERQAVVDFTTPIGYSQAELISLKTAPIAKVNGAEGKTIAVTVGSALIPVLKQIAPGVSVKTFPNIASSANALLAGQVDGLFTGQETTAQLLAKHPEFVASQTVTSGEIAFPVAKDNPQLLKALNGAIAAVMQDGTFNKIFAKWSDASMTIPDQLYQNYPGMPHLNRSAAN
jgi:polar amino acid transport system substrate-binding protein